jgi:glucokinase
LLGDFVAGVRRKAGVAAIAVAGPIRDGVVVTDTLPWRVDGDALQSQLGVSSLLLMNDLDAVARAVPRLAPEDVETLRAGRPEGRGAIAVIGLGTGLGEAFLIHSPSGYVACESEGGHMAFAPETDTELELLGFLRERSVFVSYEMVCSGMALPDLYAFVRTRRTAGRPDPEPDAIAQARGSAGDLTRAIVDSALSDADASTNSRSALELLVGILGAAAGNLALTVNASGGVYLGGGMPSRILPMLRSGQFLRRFGSKGRDSAFLAEIPVHVITNTFAGLIGAAASGLEALSS